MDAGLCGTKSSWLLRRAGPLSCCTTGMPSHLIRIFHWDPPKQKSCIALIGTMQCRLSGVYFASVICGNITTPLKHDIRSRATAPENMKWLCFYLVYRQGHGMQRFAEFPTRQNCACTSSWKECCSAEERCKHVIPCSTSLS